MSTTFNDPNEDSIAACYAIFGDDEEAQRISAKIPRPEVSREQYHDGSSRRDDDDESDMYLA